MNRQNTNHSALFDKKSKEEANGLMAFPEFKLNRRQVDGLGDG